MPMRWRWPPENSCGKRYEVLLLQARRGRAAPGVRVRASALDTPCSWNGALMICDTRLRGFSEANGSWKTICSSPRIGRSSRCDAAVMSRPSKRIVPPVGFSSRMSVRDSVVFPQPDSPTSPSVSPLAQRERHVVDGVDVADRAVDEQALLDREPLADVLDLEQRAVAVRRRLGLGLELGRHAITPFASSPIWPSAISRLERFSSSGSQQRSVCSGAADRAPRAPAPAMHCANSCRQRGRKWQPCGRVEQRRRQARDRRQALRPRPVHAGDRAQQAPRVRVLRVVEDLVDRPLLDDAPRVHHEDAVGDVGHDAEVVRDEHDARVGPLAQLLHDLEDLRLDRHVQGGGRLVGDEHRRVARQRHRDHHALAHAAGELVRVAADALPRARDADALEQLDREVVRLLRAHVAVRLDLLDDLRRRCAAPGSATSSGPGRSSRSPRPAAGAARRRSR